MQNDASTLRRDRLLAVSKEIAMHLKDHPRAFDMATWASFNIGLSMPKAREYVELVCRAHGWIIEDGIIKLGAT